MMQNAGSEYSSSTFRFLGSIKSLIRVELLVPVSKWLYVEVGAITWVLNLNELKNNPISSW